MTDLIRGTDDDGLTDADVRYVRARREQAAWYYFGREDGLPPETPRDDPRRRGEWSFALFAAAEARAYRRGEVCYLASIQDQYDRWVTAERTA